MALCPPLSANGLVRLPVQAGRSGGQGPPQAARSVLDGCEHGGTLVIVGNDDHCIMPSLISDRRKIVERGMTAAWIVEPLE